MNRLSAALVLAALLLASLPAAADHVYSHRYVLEGRLLGADGNPLPNRTVAFHSLGETFHEGPCQGGHQPVTDAFGDFRFCFHKHNLDPSAQVGASYGGANATRAIDSTFRKTVVTLTEPNETGVAPEGWAGTHLVAGRVWRTGARELEGVRVFGSTVNNATVNLTVRGPDGATSQHQAQTDGFGDFRIELRVDPATPADSISVEVEARGQRQTRVLDPESHRLQLSFFLPPEEAPPATPTIFLPATPFPGSTISPPSPWLFVAIAVGLVLAVGITWFGGHRKRE